MFTCYLSQLSVIIKVSSLTCPVIFWLSDYHGFKFDIPNYANSAPWRWSPQEPPGCFQCHYYFIILSPIDLIIFSFIFTTNLYGSNGLFMISRVETNSVNFNNPIARAQTSSPVVSTTLQRGEKRIGFLEKVDHFGDDIDDGHDVGGEDDSDDSRHLPAGLSGRTFLMKMPITLCCWRSTYQK